MCLGKDLFELFVDLWSSWTLIFKCFPRFRKFLMIIIFLNKLSVPFSFYLPSEISIILKLVLWMVSHRSCGLSALFHSFFFVLPWQDNFKVPVFLLTDFSSAWSILILMLSDAIFISFIVFFYPRICLVLFFFFFFYDFSLCIKLPILFMYCVYYVAYFIKLLLCVFL